MTLIKLQNLLGKQLGVDPSIIKESDDLINDLNADSLDIVEIVMSIEEEAAVIIEDSEFEKCNTVGATLELINNKRATNGL